MMALGTLLFSLPVVVEVPATPDSGSGSRDGGETRITLLAGGGRYAIIDRGCDNQVLATHPAHYQEAGGSIEYRFSNNLVLGVRGGAVHETMEHHYVAWDYYSYPHRESVEVARSVSRKSYINPSLAMESEQVGMGAGWIWANRDFDRPLSASERVTFHLRIGREDRKYFKVSHMENVPLWTGGSVIDIGIGSRLGPRWDLYGGLTGGEPFDGAGLGLRADYRVHPNWSIVARGRLGHSGGEAQNGVALGLGYSSRARAASSGSATSRSTGSGRP